MLVLYPHISFLWSSNVSGALTQIQRMEFILNISPTHRSVIIIENIDSYEDAKRY